MTGAGETRIGEIGTGKTGHLGLGWAGTDWVT